MTDIKQVFEGKKIMILGLGREGFSTYKLIRKYFPDIKLALSDKKELKDIDPQFYKLIKKDKNADYACGEKYLDHLNNFELIIKTPGIPNKLNEIVEARKNGVDFASQTKIFLDIYRDKIIGVTGTKGKSTTASLINHILNASKFNSLLVGNIGKPVFDYLDMADKSRFFVVEMSSHQLADLELSPHVAVFLNIYPEHLDYYKDFRDYLKAKANITKFQTESDLFFYSGRFSEIRRVAKTTKAKTFDFSKVSLPAIETSLLGKHNLENIKASILVAMKLGVGEKDIVKAIKSFKPLEDRLETVGEYNGITFVNDGLATIPEATISAIDSFNDKLITLILGGFDRGIDFEYLGRQLKSRKNVTNIILTGQVAEKMSKSLKKNKFKNSIYNLGIKSMHDVVKKCVQITQSGGIVLLSPAATSFDMYKNYKDRSDRFKSAINSLLS